MKKNRFKKRFDAINTRLVILAIAIVVIPILCTAFMIDEMKYRIKKTEDMLAQIQNDVKITTTWIDIHWGGMGDILEKMEDKIPPLKKSDINIWDLLYCGDSPNDYNFYVKAIAGNTYIWYKNPMTKVVEEIRYKDIIDDGCYIAAPVNMMETEKE